MQDKKICSGFQAIAMKIAPKPAISRRLFFNLTGKKNSINILARKYIHIQREYLTKKTQNKTNNSQVDLKSFIKC